MQYLCIYHKQCLDGFAAALAVYRHCQQQQLNCRFVAAAHYEAPPDVRGMHVYIVDFAYPRQVMIRLQQQAASLLVIDHHISAQDDLKDLPFCIFNMQHCGSGLTWQHFFPQEPLPLFFQYIEDNDLWRWQLADSHEIAAALELIEMDFTLWMPLLQRENLLQLIDTGATLLRYQQQLVNKMTQQHHIQMFCIGGFEVPAVNSNVLVSDIGHVLCEGYPFAAVYHDSKERRVFSLRSDEQGIDVAKIAAIYGGGGHFHAAGFSLTAGQQL